jgi:DNA replication protein DnaC
MLLTFLTTLRKRHIMTRDELEQHLRQLRLGGMAESLSARSQHARSESLGPLDFLALLVHDEITCRRDRLVERRIKDAGFRDRKTLDTFEWTFNRIDRALIFELATSRFIERHEDILMLGNAGTGKSHLAQALGITAIHAGFQVIYREAHRLFEELSIAALSDDRTSVMKKMSEVPLLIIDDLGMRKLPATAAEDLLELVMRRYERSSTVITSNRPLEDWPKIFGDTPAVTAFLDRLMHHSHFLDVRGKSYRLHQSSSGKQAQKAREKTAANGAAL